MKYYIETQLNSSFDEAVNKIKSHLSEFGFGAVTEMDLDQKFKEKLGIESKRYKIIGICSPKDAYDAIQLEPLIGTMLPCNIVVRETHPDKTHVSAINPAFAMSAIGNQQLNIVADKIGNRLKQLIESL